MQQIVRIYMKRKLPFILICCSCLLAGCYSKRVEKETVVPEKVVVHEQPSTDVTIHEDRAGDPYVTERTRTTTVERHY